MFLNRYRHQGRIEKVNVKGTKSGFGIRNGYFDNFFIRHFDWFAYEMVIPEIAIIRIGFPKQDPANLSGVFTLVVLPLVFFRCPRTSWIFFSAGSLRKSINAFMTMLCRLTHDLHWQHSANNSLPATGQNNA